MEVGWDGAGPEFLKCLLILRRRCLLVPCSLSKVTYNVPCMRSAVLLLLLQDEAPRQRFRPEYDADEPRGIAFPTAATAEAAASAPPREQVSYQDL